MTEAELLGEITGRIVAALEPKKLVLRLRNRRASIVSIAVREGRVLHVA